MLNKEIPKTDTPPIKKEQRIVNSNPARSQKHKKVFVEPELREYPPLRNLTFLTVSGVSGGSVY
jgi:hypothetical protein